VTRIEALIPSRHVITADFEPLT